MDEYYHNQAFGPKYYTSSYHGQGGYGLGSMFQSIWRWLQPIAVSQVKKVGKQALTTGANIISDLQAGNEPAADVIKNRAKEGTRNLQKTLIGSGIGIKRKPTFACPQMKSVSKRVKRNPKRRVSKRIAARRDIFNS